jgi:hypothetical protein
MTPAGETNEPRDEWLAKQCLALSAVYGESARVLEQALPRVSPDHQDHLGVVQGTFMQIYALLDVLASAQNEHDRAEFAHLLEKVRQTHQRVQDTFTLGLQGIGAPVQ